MLLSLEAVQQRQINQHNELVFNAYLTEALNRTKRLPRVETLFAKAQHQRRERQTLDQQRVVIRAIAAAFSGARAKPKAIMMTPEQFAKQFKR